MALVTVTFEDTPDGLSVRPQFDRRVDEVPNVGDLTEAEYGALFVIDARERHAAMMQAGAVPAPDAAPRVVVVDATGLPANPPSALLSKLMRRV